MPTLLPKQAFIPRSIANENERRQFAEKRDRLFALCTEPEQYCLLALADWYESHWHRLIAQPNIFATCVGASFELRYQWMPGPKPHPLLVAWIQTMAMVGRAINAVENRIGAWSQWRCIAFLRSSVQPGNEDVLVGVVDFLRVLPLQVGVSWAKRSLQDRLAALTTSCMASPRVSARHRMDAAMRCIDRNYEPKNYALPDGTNHLRKQCWPLLLELAQEDMQAALHIVDEQKARQGKASGFSTLDLHEAPELAYQLARALRLHRSSFAAVLLRESIQYSSFQRSKLTGEPAAVLERVMDASCRLLADWIAPDVGIPDDEVLQSIHQLLWYGNPADAYWATLPARALELVRRLPERELDRRLRVVAQVAFYGETTDPAAAKEAHTLFDEWVTLELDRVQLMERDRERDRDDLFSTVGHTVWEMSRSLEVLEDKQGSMRNRRIAAAPDHRLVRTFEMCLEPFVQRLLSQEPAVALHQLGRIAAYIHHEGLFRKYHALFREQFTQRAPLFPEDAGRALKTVIKSCGYSQSDDEIYRKTVCKETFEAMLPFLESISPEAAAHARTGVGWSPRGDI
ncbi:hypothetical protein [Polaromonas sp.]|uniref:hypothetical protein n=1 Tax=Polaromonas sp. TaxID=1869339 RepID=UPI003267AFA3